MRHWVSSGYPIASLLFPKTFVSLSCPLLLLSLSLDVDVVIRLRFCPFHCLVCLQSISSNYVTQPYILLSVVCEDVKRKVTFSFGHCPNYGGEGVYFFQHASVLNFELLLGCLCHRPQFNFCPVSLSCQAPRLHPGQVAPIKAHSCVQSTKSSANLSLDFQSSEDCKRQESAKTLVAWYIRP